MPKEQLYVAAVLFSGPGGVPETRLYRREDEADFHRDVLDRQDEDGNRILLLDLKIFDPPVPFHRASDAKGMLPERYHGIRVSQNGPVGLDVTFYGKDDHGDYKWDTQSPRRGRGRNASRRRNSDGRRTLYHHWSDDPQLLEDLLSNVPPEIRDSIDPSD